MTLSPHPRNGRTVPLLLAAGVALFPALAAFAGGKDHDKRQADAHVHGKATLSAALDGGALTLELETPLANLVGFEHAPKTDAERAALEKAVATLKQPTTLVRLPPGAGCSVGETGITLPEGHLDAEDAHGHGERHGHDDKHWHADEHGHSDATVVWRFTCATPAALDRIELTLFTAFPGMESVEAAFLSGTAQKGATLSAARPALDLR